MIDKKIEDLVEPFRTKAKVFLELIHSRFPNVAPFETLRSKGRQRMLRLQRKTWTLNSFHLRGLACDWIFNINGQPSRSNSHWQYYFLQWIATMCWMERIKQELCHTQDNEISISDQMELNSKRYNQSKDAWEQYRLHLANETFRKYI